MTASRMFTSVTTATPITLNFLIITIFLAINHLLFSSIIGNQRGVGNSTSCRKKWFVYTFVIVITSKSRNTDLILHIFYIEAHQGSWKENRKMLDRHCLHYLNTTVGEEFKGHRWVNNIVVLLKVPIITQRWANNWLVSGIWRKLYFQTIIAICNLQRGRNSFISSLEM